MSDHAIIAARIADSRERLALKLAELQRRVARARKMFSPGTYLDSPWVRLGVGVVVGYLLGRRRDASSVDEAPARSSRDGIVLAMLRSSFTTFASAVIRHAVSGAQRRDATDQS
jgi:hypothetical protein